MKKTVFICSLLLVGCQSIQTNPVNTASVVVQGVRLYFSTIVPKEISVNVIGSGSTKEKAIDSALIRSVQEAVGVLIVSETSVQSDKVINDIAIQYASGVVNKYKVVECNKTDVFNCRITAKVSPWSLQKNLLSKDSSVKVDGENLYSQHLTSKDAILQRKKLTEYLFKKIRSEGLIYKVTSVKTIPSTYNFATVQIEYEVKWDKDFRNMIIEFLQRLEKDTGGSFKDYDERQDSYIQWAPTGWSDNRVYIKTNDSNFSKLIKDYQYAPITVGIPSLRYCDRFDTTDGIFYFDSIKRTVFVKMNEKSLKELKDINLIAICSSN